MDPLPKVSERKFLWPTLLDPKCLEMIPVLLSGLFVMNQVRQGRNNPNLFYKPTLALCPPWNVVLLIYFPRERGPRGK